MNIEVICKSKHQVSSSTTPLSAARDDLRADVDKDIMPRSREKQFKTHPEQLILTTGEKFAVFR